MAIFKSRKKSASASLQTKTATADTDDILVIPDTGYDGMSSVTIHPTPSETKTVTAGTSDVTVTPTSGKYLSEVTVEPTPSQSKSVTATTSSQTVSPDTGKLLSSVTVSPQAHTTTYTPSEDTASNDMGANHDYRYVDTSGMITPTGTKSITSNGTGIDVTEYAEVDVSVPSVTPTSITPSNSSPAALTANTPVNPTANGYAIQSYEEIDVPSATYTYTIQPDMPTISRVGALEGVEQLHFHSIDPSNSDPDTITDGEIYIADGSGVAVASVTDVIPSSTPTSVSMDDVVHIQGSGVIVDSIPTPTNLTPSNSSPATITSGETYTATANGKAVSSVTDITPSNSSPVSLSSGTIYKPSASGYAISSYSSKTPSDSSPASVSSGAIIKASASGYLYSTIQPKVATGTFTRTTSSNNTINCGFAPDMIFLIKGSGTTTTISAGDFRAAYWNGWSTSYVVDDYRSSSGYYLKNEPMSDFFTITSTGFVYAKASSSTYAGTVKYIAVKYT